jgi:hypothetical protein
VGRVEGGRGERGAVGRSRESSKGLNFNITWWCVLDPTRLYFPLTKSGKTEEAAFDFRKGTRKSTFWRVMATANQHPQARTMKDGW